MFKMCKAFMLMKKTSKTASRPEGVTVRVWISLPAHLKLRQLRFSSQLI